LFRCGRRSWFEKLERRTQHEDEMTLEELRDQIDVLDRQLVELLSERARAAQMIGHLKAATALPVYEPAREKMIYSNVRAANKGPLPDIELTHIYERIIDVMRALQRDELASERNAQAHAPGQGAGAETPETGTKQ
jgi:chorismate mutase